MIQLHHASGFVKQQVASSLLRLGGVGVQHSQAPEDEPVNALEAAQAAVHGDMPAAQKNGLPAGSVIRRTSGSRMMSRFKTFVLGPETRAPPPTSAASQPAAPGSPSPQAEPGSSLLKSRYGLHFLVYADEARCKDEI